MLKTMTNKQNNLNLTGTTPLCFSSERPFAGYDYAVIVGKEEIWGKRFHVGGFIDEG